MAQLHLQISLKGPRRTASAHAKIGADAIEHPNASMHTVRLIIQFIFGKVFGRGRYPNVLQCGRILPTILLRP